MTIKNNNPIDKRMDYLKSKLYQISIGDIKSREVLEVSTTKENLAVKCANCQANSGTKTPDFLISIDLLNQAEFIYS